MDAQSVFDHAARQAQNRAGIETIAQMCAWFYTSMLEKTGSEAIASALTQQMLLHVLRSAADATLAGVGDKGVHG